MGVIAPDKVTFAALNSPFPRTVDVVHAQEDHPREVDDLDAVIAAVGTAPVTFAQPVKD